MTKRNEAENSDARKRYFELIKKWAEAELADDPWNSPVPIPFFCPICREILVTEIRDALDAAVAKAGRCPLAASAEGSPRVTELLVTPVGSGSTATKADGLREIRDFTREVECLVVVDPYAYGGEGSEKAERYVDEFAKATRIGGSSLKKLHIIYSSRHGQTTAIIEGIARRAAEADVELTDCDTDTFHDRVWIADRSRGLVVGTSFGGLGNKAAFLLELPEVDLKRVLAFIDEEGLMNGNPRRPKQAPVRKKRR